MAEEVTVVVTDSNPPGDLINGVYVGLHDNTTKALLQFDTTGNGALSDGTVIFSNVDPETYEIRVVPPNPVAVTNGKVQTVEVLDAPVAPLSNIFDIAITQEDLDTATNTNLCRCSGYFVDMTGRSVPNVSIHFSDALLPQIEYRATLNFESHGVVPSKRIAITDINGFVTVDLYRGATYTVYVEGWENVFRTILVPDVEAANIIDVLFPVVSHVEYYNSGTKIIPITAPVLDTIVDGVDELTFKVILRNGNEADGAEICFTVDDDTIISIEPDYSGTLTITSHLSGTANILVERVIDDAVLGMLPVVAIVGDLQVIVAP